MKTIDTLITEALERVNNKTARKCNAIQSQIKCELYETGHYYAVRAYGLKYALDQYKRLATKKDYPGQAYEVATILCLDIF